MSCVILLFFCNHGRSCLVSASVLYPSVVCLVLVSLFVLIYICLYWVRPILSFLAVFCMCMSRSSCVYMDIKVAPFMKMEDSRSIEDINDAGIMVRNVVHQVYSPCEVATVNRVVFYKQIIYCWPRQRSGTTYKPLWDLILCLSYCPSSFSPCPHLDATLSPFCQNCILKTHSP
jgi:hypothetical protein